MDKTIAHLTQVVDRLERLNGSHAGSKATDLTSLVSRVEAVTASLAQKFGGGGSSAPVSSGHSTSAKSEAFAEIVDGALKTYLDLSQKIGGGVYEQSLAVQKGFKHQLEFIGIASNSAEPDAQSLQKLLQPTSAALAEVQEFKDRYRTDKVLANHLTAIAEGIPALGWVMIAPKPAPYIGQMKEAAEFYTNRVLKDYKDKDEVHKEWAKSFPALLQQLQDYVKQHHTTGLTWKGKSSASVPAAAPAAAPVVAPVAAAPKPTPAPAPTPAPVSTPAPTPVQPKKEEPKKEEPKKEEPPKKVAVASENPKTKEILEKIEKIKQNDPSIEEINWTGNGAVKVEHGVAIGEAIAGNTHLKKLILTNAQINSEAAIAIANSLKTNQTIEILHLETNNIGPEGILALADAIKVNSSVTEFKLTNQSVQLTIDVEKTLAAAFDSNHSIVKFTSPGRDPGAQTVIDRALTRNAEAARQRRRLAAGAATTAAPAAAADASSSSSAADSKPAAKPAPMGQMAKTIARIEENDPTLTVLDLNGNPVCSGKHGVLIGKALVNNTNLKQLLLDGTVQDTEAAIEIANALKVNKTLELLSMEKNDIGPDGIKALADALVENVSITELRLRDQKKPVGIEVEKAFMPALEVNQSLVKLSFVFKDNGVRNYVNRGITRNTEKARQSRAADGTDSKKSGPNMVAIQKAIDGIKENSASVTEVSLNDNVVCTPDFGIAIAQGLETNTNLKSLLMDSTFQNNESAFAFAQALRKNQTLEVLSLEYNDISPEGMKALAESIADNKGLRELRLNNQKKPTGNEAERALADSLDKNTTLCKLSLVIKDAGARNTIDRVLTRNTELSRNKKK